jgi:16S rRNA (adenine1518-N6/adenine1519-N6)-dimethyltransferase
MLRQSLKSLVREPEELLAATGLQPTLRGEALTVSDFARLAYTLDRWPGAASN